MPVTPQTEAHFTATAVVIGMSDGLTVPFALEAKRFAGRRRRRLGHLCY